jgi:Caspase recruitment domain
MTEPPWKEVFRIYREDILDSADSEDILLYRVMDRLRSEGCINEEQCEIIKKGGTYRHRFGKLLDIASTEGRTAFVQFCNSLRAFGTCNKKELAEKLQRSLGTHLHDI